MAGRVGLLARSCRSLARTFEARYCTAPAPGAARTAVIEGLNEEAATEIAEGLTPEKRLVMLRALAAASPPEFCDEFFNELDANKDGFLTKGEFSTAFGPDVVTEGASISTRTLVKVGVANGMPFVGFGLLDNAIMIVAGEAIETHFGIILGLSTMAAAGLGNLISDVAGVGVAGSIEAAAHRLGFNMPHLSRAQTRLRSVHLTKAFGASLGVSLGCLLGMFPLLLYDFGAKDREAAEGAAKKEEVKVAT